MNFPPVCRTKSQLNNAVRAVPKCNRPVGEGAILTLISLGKSSILMQYTAKDHDFPVYEYDFSKKKPTDIAGFSY
jgi:hypothetical protein